ncbi:hypothetical protein AM493_17870 [Flavobacterium akiainvivens]|uniref:Uncharacterized protein n=1 Tax=Flavobacterium akiainvivens TaxID=1202724 RepID=A0A0M9VJF5_9FLAO|nr:hypothetical protein [Flavobacterium akiainvivens]KOS07702.1 hypothetical protein AM493_17870 [Flavobacterium akiainvivens]SFQ24589.1 hypothetical protein SAMN05444144_102155 [Flavobacterium akiainvivens]
MLYFKYLPYAFLGVAIIFIIDAITRYAEGADYIPSALLAVAAVAMFFIRRKSYKRYTNPGQGPKK